MVKELVEKAMRKALNRFAVIEEKPSKAIQFFIHTKNEDFSPQYFYAVDWQVVQNEGETKELNFTQDILGKKFDLTGKELLAKTYLTNYFKVVSKEEKEDVKSLYIIITCHDEMATDLAVALYKNNEELRKLQLEEIFGEE
jgi:hypothetical protein